MDADSDDGTTYARDACTRMKKCVRSTTGATARLSSTVADENGAASTTGRRSAKFEQSSPNSPCTLSSTMAWSSTPRKGASRGSSSPCCERNMPS